MLMSVTYCVRKLRLTYLLLGILKLLEASNGGTDSRGSRSAQLPASSSNNSLATSARPDASSLSSDGVLTAE